MASLGYCQNVHLGHGSNINNDIDHQFYSFFVFVKHIGESAIEITINHGCPDIDLKLAFNISNIVGPGNLVSFEHVKQHHHVVYTFGTKYAFTTDFMTHSPHVLTYRSLVQVKWDSFLSCPNSSLTVQFHNLALVKANVPYLTAKTYISPKMRYQIPYYERIHMFSDPEVDLKNKSYNDIKQICKEAGSSVFYYLTEQELPYVFDWLKFYGTSGAPVFIITGMRKGNVRLYLSTPKQIYLSSTTRVSIIVPIVFR